MIIITSREFRENQKKYLDLVDKNKQVVIKRRNKSYQLKPITEDDRFFSNPEVIAEIMAGADEIKKGKYIKVKRPDLDKYLGL